jgi:hypothetical protein
MATPELQKGRMAYVRFERRPIEDRLASLKNGHYTTVDMDFAIISPLGSKDTVVRLVKDWFIYLDQQINEERVPQEWVDKYKLAYERFKAGEEAPLDGTAIKGWPVLSPAQQQNLIAIGIKTVEDLASCTEEAIARIGLGGRSLREKAKNWLDAANNIGKLAERMTAFEILAADLKQSNESKDTTIAALKAQIEEIKNREITA